MCNADQEGGELYNVQCAMLIGIAGDLLLFGNPENMRVQGRLRIRYKG